MWLIPHPAYLKGERVWCSSGHKQISMNMLVKMFLRLHVMYVRKSRCVVQYVPFEEIDKYTFSEILSLNLCLYFYFRVLKCENVAPIMMMIMPCSRGDKLYLQKLKEVKWKKYICFFFLSWLFKHPPFNSKYTQLEVLLMASLWAEKIGRNG